jgi:hypothetical protein
MKKSKPNQTRKIYSTKDYQSNNGMLVAIWGPSAWHFMHTMSFNYPVHPTIGDKRNYRAYILNLVNVLPCGKCRQNLKENFKKLPLRMIDMRSRDTFSRYVYNLHELINHMLGKNSGLSYEQVKERYEHFRARCSKLPSKTELLPKMKHYSLKKNAGSGYVSGTSGSGSVEKGCTEPLIGEKAKCILKIVPEKTKCKTFSVDAKCVKKHRKTQKNK